jgi:hypothetical protein
MTASGRTTDITGKENSTMIMVTFNMTANGKTIRAICTASLIDTENATGKENSTMNRVIFGTTASGRMTSTMGMANITIAKTDPFTKAN